MMDATHSPANLGANLTTLIRRYLASGVHKTDELRRLEAATLRLEDLVDVTGSSSAHDSTPNLAKISESEKAPSASPLQSPALKAFQVLMHSHVAPFESLSSEIGGLVALQAKSVVEAFEVQGKIIEIASQHQKPSYICAEFQALIAPLNELLREINEIKDKNRSSPLFNHLSTVADGMAVMAWIAIERTPVTFVDEIRESAQFYANRVIKEYKEKDVKHVQWARSFLSLLSELKSYVQQTHSTGLGWNSKGNTLTTVMKKNELSEAHVANTSVVDSAGPP